MKTLTDREKTIADEDCVCPTCGAICDDRSSAPWWNREIPYFWHLCFLVIVSIGVFQEGKNEYQDFKEKAAATRRAEEHRKHVVWSQELSEAEFQEKQERARRKFDPIGIRP